MNWRFWISDKTLRKFEELRIYCQRQNCNPGILVSRKVRFMYILRGKKRLRRLDGEKKNERTKEREKARKKQRRCKRKQQNLLAFATSSGELKTVNNRPQDNVRNRSCLTMLPILYSVIEANIPLIFLSLVSTTATFSSCSVV